MLSGDFMNNDIKTNLSKRLKNILEEKNMTQLELSKRSTVTEATISNFLNCKQLPKLEVVSKIADVLNVSVDYLLGRTNIRFSQKEVAKNNEEKIIIAANSDVDLSDFDDDEKEFITNFIKMMRSKKKD